MEDIKIIIHDGDVTDVLSDEKGVNVEVIDNDRDCEGVIKLWDYENKVYHNFYGIAYADQFGKGFCSNSPWIIICEDEKSIVSSYEELKAYGMTHITPFFYNEEDYQIDGPFNWDFIRTHKVHIDTK